MPPKGMDALPDLRLSRGAGPQVRDSAQVRAFRASCEGGEPPFGGTKGGRGGRGRQEPPQTHLSVAKTALPSQGDDNHHYRLR